MDKRMNHLIQGALILTIAGVVSKILSAFYRIPIQNLTRDIGFYLYQQIYPFIATVMILSLYSFPAAISQMGATLGDKRHQLHYFILPNLFLLFVINGSIGTILFVIAPFFAKIAGVSHLFTAYRLIAICFFCIPIIALIRGLFQAEERMEQTAISQVIEQLFRVTAIIVVAYLISIDTLPIYDIAVYGVGATIIGMVVASFYLIVTYRSYRKKRVIQPLQHIGKTPYRYYLHTLIIFGFAVAMNHMIFIIIQLADVLSVVPLLEKYGQSTLMAMDEKGVFDRAVPLIQLGMVVGSSFALAFIPFLASKKDEEKEAIQIIQDALAITVYLAVGATIGLFVLFPEANLLLFNDTKGIHSMRIFILAIGLLAVIMTIQAVLQSYGERLRTACYIGSLLMFKLLFNYLLIPSFGIYGAAIATMISLLILYVMTMVRLRKKFHHLQLFARVDWKALCFASIIMIVLLYSLKYIVVTDFSRFGLFAYVMFLISLGALAYGSVLLRYDALTEEQLMALPFSSKLLTLRDLVSRQRRKEEKE